jgi:site-specific DNA-methyltransferase (cytosine-N4-specific)
VHQGDSREKLKEMPEESVDMVVTSPPYYGLRDYGDDVESIWGGEDDCKHDWGTVTKKPRGGNNTEENPPDVGGNEHTQETRLRGGDGIESNYCSKCGAWKGQLGLEPSPIQFVRNITEICNEIYRVLKPEGSFYLNLGDTYAGGGGISGVPDDWDSASTQDREKYPDSVPARDVEFPDKCKMLIPHRTAISLMDNGWILRNDIVWNKPNPMPESVTDRRCTSFEFVFHFVKSKDYYFDMDSVRQPYAESSKSRYNYEFNADIESQETAKSPAVGAGDIDRNPNGKIPRDVMEVKTAKHSDAHFAVFPQNLIEPHIKSSCPEDGVVLDPFIGSGTTAVVAEQLDRDWIGIDLNKDYVDMSFDRIENETTKIFDDRSIMDY